MGATTRFGVSMDRELAGMLDRLTDSAGYPNRSEAIRSLVRQELIRTGGEEDDREVAGVITLIYRYGTRLAPAPIADDSSIHVSAPVNAPPKFTDATGSLKDTSKSCVRVISVIIPLSSVTGYIPVTEGGPLSTAYMNVSVIASLCVSSTTRSFRALSIT